MKVNQFGLDSKQYLDCEKFESIINYVTKNVKSDETSYELLDLVLKYLQNYPQQISLVSTKCFIHLVSIGEETLHPLVLFLALRHDSINYHLKLENLPLEKWIYLMSVFYQKNSEIMFDPIFVKHTKKKIDASIDIYEMLLLSPPWFNENVDFFIGLHLVEFDENECEKLFTKLKNNWSTCKIIFSVTKEAITFIDLIAAKCNKEIEFTQLLINDLFSVPPKLNKSLWLSCQVINNLKMFEANCSIEMNDWETLIKQSIQCGLIEVNPDYTYIRVFRRLIKKAFVDKSVVLKTFEFLVSHSRFSSIMLSRDGYEEQKEEVLRMIQTLVKKEPSIMALSHIPLYLCSYNATLSVTDQLLLKILFLYEENSIPMSNYRPYLWGSFAASHYQVTNHLISKTLNSFPSTTEILSYVPFKRLQGTISNFPVGRNLHIKNQKIIRHDNFSTDPKKMFDPAFFLPMISSLLATEAPLSIEKFTKNGCLSMILVCLGSSDIPMRTAAYHVLTLLRSHLFCRRAENMFWDYFISWIGRGIQGLHLKPPPQLSMIQALFLSRMALGISNHQKGIDMICCKLLIARPAARLNHIPELMYFLTVPADLQPSDKTLFLRWYLLVIRDGTHSKKDWSVIKSMDLLNIIVVIFYNSNEKERLLVLEIMEKVFRIEPATNGGTGPWALTLMSVISQDPKQLTESEYCVLFRCLKSLSNSSYINIPIVYFVIYLFLEHGNQNHVCHEGFITLNQIVSKYHDAYKVITKENLMQMLSYGENTKVLSDDEVLKCRSVLEHGVYGIRLEEISPYIFLPTLVKILEKKC